MSEPKSIGEQIVDEIIKQGMVQVVNATPPEGENLVFAWKANCHDQLNALIERHVDEQKRVLRRCLVVAVLALGDSPTFADNNPVEILEWIKDMAAKDFYKQRVP